MTPAQMTLIRTQFGQIGPGAEAFAARFYTKLFALDPSLRALFPEDLTSQRRKLIQALAHVILSLHDLDAVIADVRALGERHAAYGVKTVHYDTVGLALLNSLADTLGPSFDESAQAAWALAYGILADAMVEAAAKAERSAA